MVNKKKATAKHGTRVRWRMGWDSTNKWKIEENKTKAHYWVLWCARHIFFYLSRNVCKHWENCLWSMRVYLPLFAFETAKRQYIFSIWFRIMCRNFIQLSIRAPLETRTKNKWKSKTKYEKLQIVIFSCEIVVTKSIELLFGANVMQIMNNVMCGNVQCVMCTVQLFSHSKHFSN